VNGTTNHVAGKSSCRVTHTRSSLSPRTSTDRPNSIAQILLRVYRQQYLYPDLLDLRKGFIARKWIQHPVLRINCAITLWVRPNYACSYVRTSVVGARKIHMCTKVPRTRSSGFENWFSKNQHAYKRDCQAFSAGFPDGIMLIIATTLHCPQTRKGIWKPVKYWYHPTQTIVTSPKEATMQ
jgi:hypothetical protein